MANYSLKSFLRQAPRRLLLEHLAKREVGVGLGWENPGAASLEAVYGATENAPEKVRQRLECEFHDILAMACQAGVAMLIDEGRDRHHGVELAETLGSMGSDFEAAYWTFLHHPEVFDVAKRFYHADTLPRWDKRHGLPDAKPSTTKKSARELQRRISQYYRRREGRGLVCKVDHYARGGKLLWFAYPQDFATGRLAYSGQKLRFQTQRPAFEVIFIYDKEERSLDTWVRGDKRTFSDLREIFGNVILGVDLRFTKPPKVTYDLSCLLDPANALPIQPEDDVESVVLLSLRLRVKSSGDKRITLEADTAENPNAVGDLLSDVTASERLPREGLEVVWAKIALRFRDENGGSDRERVFTVAYPSRCSLKHEGEDAKARELLRRWGVDLSRTPDGPTAKRGPALQHLLWK